MAKDGLGGRVELCSAAFMCVPDIITVSTVEDMVYLEVNRAFLETFGLSREEVIGRPADAFDIWTGGFPRERMLELARSGGGFRDLGVSLRVRGGEIRRFRLSGNRVESDAGPCLVVAARDDTERSRAEEDLVKSRFLLERAERMARIGSWEFDFNTRMASASPGAHAIYGLEPGDFSVAEAEAVPLPEYRPVLDRARDELIAEGKPYDVEFRIKRKGDGRILDIWSLASWDAKQRKMFGMIMDVTERKRIETELKAINAEAERRVEERTRELERAHDGLVRAEKLAVLGQLVAGISHEINSPLGAISSSASYCASLLPSVLEAYGGLLEGPCAEEPAARAALIEAVLDPERRESHLTTGEERAAARSAAERLSALGLGPGELAEAAAMVARCGVAGLPERLAPFVASGGCLDALAAAERIASLAGGLATIHGSVERATRIVEALRSYMTFRTAEELRPDPLDSSLDEALALFESEFRHGVALERRYLFGGRVRCRRGELVQTWVNLVQNAIQAMEKKGSLAVETAAEGEEAIVRIIDDGPGIPPEIGQRVFEPFFTTKRSGEGTGLGLDIARRIVEGHGGSISFVSRPGRTCFEVRLPTA